MESNKLLKQINGILDDVQKNSGCHQRLLLVLEKIYKQTPFEDFFEVLMYKLKVVFQQKLIDPNPFVDKVLDFNAKFVALITKKEQGDDWANADTPNHPFLSRIIQETLVFHDLIYVNTRYHSCKFIALVLEHIGSQIQLDNDICDAIQDAMLQRVEDPKASIRVKAHTALVRLQEPLNPECPVIKAFLDSFCDKNALVRREAVARVAPNTITITKVLERVRDVDAGVRLAAMQRLADIGPRLLKIVDRQAVLKSGFSEGAGAARKGFLNHLLPKWLTHYDGDYLNFIRGLKLDADEEDINTTYTLAKQILDVFFARNPIREIIKCLPVGGDKLIPLADLTNDNTMFWFILICNLRGMGDEGEPFLDQIMPEFTPFCHYIDGFINLKTSKPLDEWENMDYQCILHYLLQMAEGYDFADESGRRAFNDLAWKVLQSHRLQAKNTVKLTAIARKLAPSLDSFVQEMCNLIAEVESPLVETQPTQQQLREKEFLLAQLKVKVNILEGDQEEAIDKKEYDKLDRIKQELAELRQKIDAFNTETTEAEKRRVVKTDSDTICHCLDLLIGLLNLPDINQMHPNLRTLYTDFLTPLLSSEVEEINWRVLNCLGLYSIIDRDVALKSAKIFCIPIAMYRAVPNYNKNALTISVSAVSDLIRIYGVDIYGSEKSDTNDKNTNTRRRLYCNEDRDEIVEQQTEMSIEFVIEIILDMLDDECDDIRNVAVDALTKLVLNGYNSSPMLITRLILKWYNPLTEKQDIIQQKLGMVIEQYTQTVKGAKEVVEKAVIPILTSISNAPKSSPLADIDVDNLLRFLSVITNTTGTKSIVHVHSNLAHILCNKMATKPSDKLSLYLTKMLCFLEIPPENRTTVKELIRVSEIIVKELKEKNVAKYMDKFIAKLKGGEPMDTVLEEDTAVENTNLEEDKENDTSNNSNKRRSSVAVDELIVNMSNNSNKRRSSVAVDELIVNTSPNTRFAHKKRPVVFSNKKTPTTKELLPLQVDFTPKIKENRSTDCEEVAVASTSQTNKIRERRGRSHTNQEVALSSPKVRQIGKEKENTTPTSSRSDDSIRETRARRSNQQEKGKLQERNSPRKASPAKVQPSNKHEKVTTVEKQTRAKTKVKVPDKPEIERKIVAKANAKLHKLNKKLESPARAVKLLRSSSNLETPAKNSAAKKSVGHTMETRQLRTPVKKELKQSQKAAQVTTTSSQKSSQDSQNHNNNKIESAKLFRVRKRSKQTMSATSTPEKPAFKRHKSNGLASPAKRSDLNVSTTSVISASSRSSNSSKMTRRSMTTSPSTTVSSSVSSSSRKNRNQKRKQQSSSERDSDNQKTTTNELSPIRKSGRQRKRKNMSDFIR